MNWPFELIFSSIFMVFMWIALLRFSAKIEFSKYFVLINLLIYLFYLFLLFKPLFSVEEGRGGAGFAAGFYIIILSPIHLALAFFAVLIFKKTSRSEILSKVLLYIALPAFALLLGYLIAERRNEIKEIESQLEFEKVAKEQRLEEINSSRSENDFEAFLLRFFADSTFQKEYVKLPLAIFYLNDTLEVDSVTHIYEHNWHPINLTTDDLISVHNDWDYLRKKSDKKVISKNEGAFKTDYNFRFEEDWQLFEIRRRRQRSD